VITSAPYSDDNGQTLSGWMAEAWKDFSLPVEEQQNWAIHAWAVCAVIG
jgi:hypothetical protein